MSATQRIQEQNPIRRALKAAFSSELMQRLTYPHSPDRFIELFAPTEVREETVGTIASISHPTPRSVRVTVMPNDRWQGFQAGQYVEFAVEINGRRERRMFSPAQSQHGDGALEFTMAVNPEGRLTRFMKTQARPGTRVFLGSAAGTFALPQTRPRHIVLISAGSGITPVMSMLRTLVDEGYEGRIDFIHYCRSAEEALYSAALDRLDRAFSGLDVHTIHTRADGGHFSAEQLERLVPDYAEAHTFVCGPAPLLEATREFYDSRGLAERHHQEAFSLAKPAANDSGDAPVRFARSDIESINQGTTLLEQAEAAGLSPEHGCRMGVCFSCSCLKKNGRVRDLRTGEISDDGEAEIQICVSQPVGPVTLDI